MKETLGKKEGEEPTAVEYAVMLALIIVVCIAALHSFNPSALHESEPVTPPSPPVEE